MCVCVLVCLCVCKRFFFFFVKDFSGTTAPRFLKFGTNVGYDLLYCVKENRHVSTYHSLYFPFFFDQTIRMPKLIFPRRIGHLIGFIMLQFICSFRHRLVTECFRYLMVIADMLVVTEIRLRQFMTGKTTKS